MGIKTLPIDVFVKLGIAVLLSNESLSMKVNELKSMANITIVAENEGLSYNSDNVKVITSN